jgi:hypothetical protein
MLLLSIVSALLACLVSGNDGCNDEYSQLGVLQIFHEPENEPTPQRVPYAGDVSFWKSVCAYEITVPLGTDAISIYAELLRTDLSKESTFVLKGPPGGDDSQLNLDKRIPIRLRTNITASMSYLHFQVLYYSGGIRRSSTYTITVLFRKFQVTLDDLVVKNGGDIFSLVPQFDSRHLARSYEMLVPNVTQEFTITASR